MPKRLWGEWWFAFKMLDKSESEIITVEILLMGEVSLKQKEQGYYLIYQM
jgi:hypothetical protein